ncbi:MAG: lytic transglycosylase domain-containing protein [Sphingobium sp.]
MRFPFLALVMLVPTADAQNEIVQPIPPGASAALPQGSGSWDVARNQIMTSADAVMQARIIEWRRLQQSDALDFSAYANFLTANPGWPGEARMRRLAETSINPSSFAPTQVTAFFTRYPPRTATGHARYALALSALGRTGEAQVEARNAWRGGSLAPADENQILGLFGGTFTADDNSTRADALLWAKNPTGAERVLGYLPANIRPVVEARIAMQRGAPDAGDKIQLAQPYATGNAGFIADRTNWLNGMGNGIVAQSILAGRGTLVTRPADAEKWFENLLSNARAATKTGDWSTAYAIASKVDDAYAPQIDVRDRSIGERDDYTSLTWLAGFAAYYNLYRPRDAVAMFDRYASGARSPQTISKGYYWAGRAAMFVGDAGLATRYFTQAAAYPDQFYGQLSLERLGRAVPSPASFAQPVVVTTVDRDAFANRSVVRAAKLLGAMGQWREQSQFLRAISENVITEQERALTAELARTLGRPDLGVMVGRRALADGMSGYGLSSFPSVPVPQGHEANWTMIHAIARQESQFDKSAVSSAGARGLMQLMPGTAREVAQRKGLSYTADALTGDPSYNIQLGSSYFQQMLYYYGGSYPLAIAAYNAGPGNVNKWIAANGDPRLPGTDMLRWIESIPIYETRNYVQRVLENAVVYDSINPGQARFRGSATPLSKYLGKNDVG